jgi:DNA-binding NarL/FixJ family response regulator
MAVRLLIVDDHDVVRMGLATALRVKPEWEVCGQASDGPNALVKVAQLHPDVVILDITMPGMTGFDTAAEIRRIAPEVKLVFFSIHDVPSTARIVGADAFVSKALGVWELVTAIERLTSGSAGAPSASSPNTGPSTPRTSSGGNANRARWVISELDGPARACSPRRSQSPRPFPIPAH